MWTKTLQTFDIAFPPFMFKNHLKSNTSIPGQKENKKKHCSFPSSESQSTEQAGRSLFSTSNRKYLLHCDGKVLKREIFSPLSHHIYSILFAIILLLRDSPLQIHIPTMMSRWWWRFMNGKVNVIFPPRFPVSSFRNKIHISVYI
jgi:hypothetical protein